jgi:glycosyltransferase involved in cell wall biosynthesis
MRILRALDALVPISKRIRDDFHFDPAKTIVFSGGLTRQGRELMRRGSGEIKLYAVFAGALEKYNGIDRLVERWSGSGLDMDLHVFGRGSCEAIVRAASNRCPRIVFHGFQPEAEVTEWQARALATFCLRYSFGIDACYFFPSKLINALSAPGAVVVNSFDGFPACLADACFMIDDNLDCLEDCIASIRPNDALEKQRLQRRKWLREECDWQTLIQELVGRARLRETFL